MNKLFAIFTLSLIPSIGFPINITCNVKNVQQDLPTVIPKTPDIFDKAREHWENTKKYSAEKREQVEEAFGKEKTPYVKSPFVKPPFVKSDSKLFSYFELAFPVNIIYTKENGAWLNSLNKLYPLSVVNETMDSLIFSHTSIIGLFDTTDKIITLYDLTLSQKSIVVTNMINGDLTSKKTGNCEITQ